MDITPVTTADGSHTLLHPQTNETYHSVHGAIGESRHVFIEAGFRHLSPGKDRLNILEVGFGTGLNAMLTQLEAETLGIHVEYTSLETMPLGPGTWELLNYPRMLCSVDYTRVFEKLHLAAWGKAEEISTFFRLHKICIKLENYQPPERAFDLVYFDAFSPSVQPELWTPGIFEKIFTGMKAGSVLTTYSVKGEVTRALKTAGFRVEKIPGPPGKRQIARAFKT